MYLKNLEKKLSVGYVVLVIHKYVFMIGDLFLLWQKFKGRRIILKCKKKIISLNSEECENLEQLDNRVKASYDKIDGSFVCKFCSKTFNKVFNVKEHVEIHFDGISFPCDLCDKTFRSRHNLRSHRNRNHRYT